MTIATILATKGSEVVTLTTEHTVAEAVKLLAERRIGAVPVMRGEQVAGIFSERDVIHCVAARGAAGLDGTVGEAMTAPAITVTRDEAVLGALTLMTRRRIRHLPVVEGDNRLIGFLSLRDLLLHDLDEKEVEVRMMRAYMNSSME